MHYCLLFISKELPTDEFIDEKLRKFNDEEIWDYEKDERKEETKDYPFTWDWLQVGGRYGGLIKYKLDEEDYKYFNHPLNKIKVRSNLFDKLNENYKDKFFDRIEECNFVNYCGRHDDYLYCDGCKISSIKDIKRLKNGYCFYNSINDLAYARESWNGNKWIKNKEYDKLVEQELKDNNDNYLTIIDIHD